MQELIIPEKLQAIASILRQYLKPLLSWISELILTEMVANSPRHRLVQLHTQLDFSELERLCANYHQPSTGRGRPVSHSVPKLLRLVFLRYWHDLSLRRTQELLTFNMLARWFVGYGLHEKGPDYTTLHLFEKYLSVHHPTLFFDTVLSQIDAAFDDGHAQLQIGDTFALQACAALESIIQRLRHASYLLLTVWRSDDPEGYAAKAPLLDEATLFGMKGERRDYFLAREAWYARLRLTVRTVEEMVSQLPPAAERSERLRVRLAQLQKILADELHVERDENGAVQAVSFLPSSKRGQFRICSATDPEATVRNHGEGKKALGYNVSVAATPNFIRAIQADTGSTSDVTPIPDLLQAQAKRGDSLPEKLLYDQVAGHGKTAHLVQQVSQGRTQLVAYPLSLSQRTNRFSPEAFTLSADGLKLTCPNGRSSRRRYRSGSGAGWTFRFIAAQCAGCPLLKQCRGSAKPPATKRNVFINDYRLAYDQLVAYAQTDEFKKEMKLRPNIERIIAGLVLHNGARRARFRGVLKANFQMKMAATVYNAKRWLVLLDEKAGRRKRPTRRRWGVPPPS